MNNMQIIIVELTKPESPIKSTRSEMSNIVRMLKPIVAEVYLKNDGFITLAFT